MFRSSKRMGLEFERFFEPRQPIMSIASRDLVLTSKSSSVKTVTKLMLNRFRRIPLVTKDMKLDGIVGITDVLDFLGGGEKFNIFKKKAAGIDIPVNHIKAERVHTINPNTSLVKALEIFRMHGRGAYPLVQNGVIKGIVSEWDFVDKIKDRVDVSAGEIMTEKPIIAKKDYSVWDVAKMMCRGGFRRLPVTDNGILVGIVTPFDVLSFLVRGERVSKHKLQSTKIERIMNRFVTTIEPEVPVDTVISVMKNKKVGGLPVVEDEELVGIITERDILNALVI